MDRPESSGETNRIELQAGGMAANRLMPLGRMRPKLAHAAEHGDLAPGIPQGGEGVQPGLHRIRIGIVGVVDEQDAGDGLGLHAA